jgi:hypothetical protein
MGNEAGVLAVKRWTFVLTSLLVWMVAVAGPTVALGAEPTKVFDPVLSLTGGPQCPTSTLDPVADPGCTETPYPASFAQPTSVSTDFYGDIYVTSFGKSESGAEGRIDVFSPTGTFITELPVQGPQNTAVDSDGFLYVRTFQPEGGIRLLQRYEPTVYDPAAEEIVYGNPPFLVSEAESPWMGLRINPENDHLYANLGFEVAEFDSAANGNKYLGSVAKQNTGGGTGVGLAVDIAHGKVYAEATNLVEVFELAAPHNLLFKIEGSSVPAGHFIGNPAIAVDEGTGRVFIYDAEASKVYEFSEDGTYLATIEHGFQPVVGAELTIDNGPFSPNGKQNPAGRYLFVPSNRTGVGHSYAFGPKPLEAAPDVESVSFANVTEDEAELRALVNPNNLPTTYTFEYTTLSQFEVEGFTGASVAGSGQLAGGGTGVQVSATAVGLSPGTTYRFRAVATNAAGSDDDEAEGQFRTYRDLPLASCPNDQLRTGFSAALPDCRAYELVTPPNTNARAPLGLGSLGTYFTTRQASPAGDKVSFGIEGGAIPGLPGTGGNPAFARDPYLSRRSESGWTTSFAGPTGQEAPAVLPGSFSSDQGYSFWSTGKGEGTAAIGGGVTTYVRYPDGHSELLGTGSIGTDPRALGRFINEGGSHIIFLTGQQIEGTPVVAQRIEPNSPPKGIAAIYDRTADRNTHLVSLLPGNVTPSSSSEYLLSSLDGRGVAFRNEGNLFLRYNNQETYEIGTGAVTFAGISSGGSRIFYVEGGKLLRFDATTGAVTPFTLSGTAIPVNVSANGNAAYLVSTSVLTTQANPEGTKAKAGQRNLYLSEEGAISFVGTVTERDVNGEELLNETVDGLGLWAGAAVENGRFGRVSARSTPDGSVLLFESRAPLASYDSGGKAEIYRYDAANDELTCLSCNPTEGAATGDSSLQESPQEGGGVQLLSTYDVVANLRGDGRRAFFQSPEALVPGDTDELQDVYEWERQGVGSCSSPEGCVYLISSAQSRRTEALFAVSDSGDDAFFFSSDLLVPADTEETPSIYDARVGGGFPESASAECEGEGCRPGLAPAPPMSNPATAPSGSPAPPKHCPKGKRKVRKHGKTRCVKKHRKHHRQRAGSKKKGGRK